MCASLEQLLGRILLLLLSLMPLGACAPTATPSRTASPSAPERSDVPHWGMSNLSLSQYGAQGLVAHLEAGEARVEGSPQAASLHSPASPDTSSQSSPTAAGTPTAASPGPVGVLPWLLSAQRMHLDTSTGRGWLEQEVLLEHGTLRLRCSRLEVELLPGTSSVASALATGEVRVEQDAWSATAGQARFDANSGLLILESGPVLRRGDDWLEGGRIEWQLEQRVVTCEGCRLRLSPARRESAP